MFLLFAGDNYYPIGGAFDMCAKPFETVDLAMEFYSHFNNSERNDWAHIYSVKESKIVKEYVIERTYSKGEKGTITSSRGRWGAPTRQIEGI